MSNVSLTVDVNFVEDKDFEEAQHPRDRLGEFASKGGGSGSAKVGGRIAGTPPASFGHLPAKSVGGKRVSASGGALPDHIRQMRIPPAWTNVTYNPDPKGALWVTGHDVKGRKQYVYSPEFAGKQAEAKFRRIHELDKKFDSIKRQNDTARKSNDPRVRDAADAVHLIMHTGIRPGSENDTKAKEKAYGATTLEGRHVVKSGQETALRFVGKKGVHLEIPVRDPDTAKMLQQRAKLSGPNGQLFGNINERTLLQHIAKFDGGGFHTKDFRTLVGTRSAREEVAKQPVPTDAKSYKKAVMSVAKSVSEKLGNTPTIALQAYISPTVFTKWRESAHV